MLLYNHYRTDAKDEQDYDNDDINDDDNGDGNNNDDNDNDNDNDNGRMTREILSELHMSTKKAQVK